MRKLLDRLDQRYVKVCAYASATVLLTLIAGMVLYFSSGFFVNLWLLICAVLEPAVYGALIAYLVNPVVIKVSHAFKNAGILKKNYRARRVIGMVVCILGFAALLAGVATIMVLVITRSLSGLSISSIQELLNSAQGAIDQLIEALRQRAVEYGILESGTQAGGSAGIDLLSALSGMVISAKDIASTLLFSVIFSVYILIDGDRVGGYCLRVIEAVFGVQVTQRLMGLLEDADYVFSGYIRGQFTDAFVVGVLTAIVLTLAGVPYGPVVGLVTGLGNLIPYVGAPMGILTTVLVCVADGSTTKIVVGIVLLALIMFVDSNVINPKLLSDNVEVHPLLVVAALIAGGAVGGLAGMLAAVPTAAFLKIQLDRWLDRREERLVDDVEEESAHEEKVGDEA